MPGRRHPAAEFPLPLLASLAAPSPCSLRSQPPPPQAGAGICPLPRSVVPPSRPFPRKRGWDMPARRHPATDYRLQRI